MEPFKISRLCTERLQRNFLYYFRDPKKILYMQSALFFVGFHLFYHKIQDIRSLILIRKSYCLSRIRLTCLILYRSKLYRIFNPVIFNLRILHLLRIELFLRLNHIICRFINPFFNKVKLFWFLYLYLF